MLLVVVALLLELLLRVCFWLLQELSRRITMAMKEAHGKSVAGMKEKMKQLAQNLGLPQGMGGGM